MKIRLALLFIAIFYCSVLAIDIGKDLRGKFITEKDIQFELPTNFPEPVYDIKSNPITVGGFVLGRTLFYDPILSIDSTISCASCHILPAAFAHTDHAISHGVEGRFGKRNVPAIQNVLWQPNFMWDGGITHLDFQPLAPISGFEEFAGSVNFVLDKLNQTERYRKLFYEAFGDSVVSTNNLLRSFSQFMIPIISNQSKYDNYLSGKDTLSNLELTGLRVFRKKCGSCHSGLLFTDFSIVNNGIYPDTFINDFGLHDITRKPEDKMKFRVPSLRNVAVTYPYMHDGRFRNLQKVIEFYANGDFYPTADPRMRIVGKISNEEQEQLFAFLLTLTDYKILYDTRFLDPQFIIPVY